MEVVTNEFVDTIKIYQKLLLPKYLLIIKKSTSCHHRICM